MDLFKTGLAGAPGAPLWPELPEDARSVLTGLMTQLILNHAAEAATSSSQQTTMSRSWTGELLAPVLAESSRGAIQTFDAVAVAAKQKGDVSIEELGRSAKLPWEVDGRKWHTLDRIAHTGQPCRWDGQALTHSESRVIGSCMSRTPGVG